MHFVVSFPCIQNFCDILWGENNNNNNKIFHLPFSRCTMTSCFGILSFHEKIEQNIFDVSVVQFI